MMGVLSIRIIVLLLVVAGMWHLLTSRGKWSNSVLFFTGRVGLVLGALMFVGLLIGKLNFRSDFGRQHVSHRTRIETVSNGHDQAVKARLRKKHAKEETEVSIDAHWDRLNDARIHIPLFDVKLVTADEMAVVDSTANATEDKSAPITSSETTEMSDVAEASKDSESLGDKGSQAQPAGKHPQDASAKSVAISTKTEGASNKNPNDKVEPRTSATLVAAELAASGARPEWVIHPPKRIGNSYRRVVVSGPFSTLEECHQELAEILRQTVYQRMAAKGADDPAYRDFTPATFEVLGIGIDYIYREICRDEFVQSLETSVGPMKQVYLLLEFDPPIEQHLGDVWRQYQVQHRLEIVAILASAGLLLLGLVYGLLKVDTWTRGYYSKRLLLGVPAVIIGLVLLWLV
jgi:hypothetical protein